MAKPDTDQGWFKMAYELDAALCFAGFTQDAQTVLRYIRAQTFGKSKAKVAYLPQTILASRIGKPRQAVSRAVKELVDSGAVVKVKDDQYRFLKDYENWTRGDKLRLTPREVADCKAAPGYAKAFHPLEVADESDIKSDDTYSSHKRSSVIKSDVNLSSNPMSVVIKSDVKNSVPPITPSCESPASERLENNTETNTQFACESDSIRSEGEDPTAKPAQSTNGVYPAGVDPQAPNLISPADRAELDRVAALCEVYFSTREDLRRVIDRREGAYPVWAYGFALDLLRKAPPNKVARAYFVGIIARVAADGEDAAKQSQASSSATGEHDPYAMTPEQKAKDDADREAYLAFRAKRSKR